MLGRGLPGHRGPAWFGPFLLAHTLVCSPRPLSHLLLPAHTLACSPPPLSHLPTPPLPPVDALYPHAGPSDLVTRDTIRITRPLLSVLLELAADADPRPVNVLLVATPAGDLEPIPDAERMDGSPASEGRPDGQRVGPDVPLADLDPGTPVYSDFYFPDVGNAVRNVFGIDLGTPAGQSHGRFLSHPTGDPEMSVRDDLHAVVLVAIPPWRATNVSAYERRSTPCSLAIVAAGTPEHDFDG